MKDESWLNGWKRNGSTVAMGSGIYCAGCGKFLGTFCLVFDPSVVYPEKEPNFPFNTLDCPVHSVNLFSFEEMLKDIPLDIIRKEIIRRKEIK